MKSQVLHTVWCNISGGAGGEIWLWSLSGVKGLNFTGYCKIAAGICLTSFPDGRCNWICFPVSSSGTRKTIAKLNQCCNKSTKGKCEAAFQICRCTNITTFLFTRIFLLFPVKKGGLLSAKDLREDNEFRRKRDKELLDKMDPTLSGRDAETVHRNKEGKIRNLKMERLRKREEEKKKEAEDEKFMQWGKGWVEENSRIGLMT